MFKLNCGMIKFLPRFPGPSHGEPRGAGLRSLTVRRLKETSLPRPRHEGLLAGWWLGHLSEKYESQLGWLETQYMGE